jgi:hypothetical protein
MQASGHGCMFSFQRGFKEPDIKRILSTEKVKYTLWFCIVYSNHRKGMYCVGSVVLLCVLCLVLETTTQGNY